MSAYNGNQQRTGIGEPFREVALYYPGAMWTSGEWIKTLLLFFDGVALLARNASDDPSSIIDMTIAEPLFEKSMLEILDIKTLVDEEISKRFWSSLEHPTRLDALDAVGRNEDFYYGTRVYNTLNGPEPSIEMMEMRNDLLGQIGAGVAVREYGKGPALPLNIRLWAPLLGVVAQILRPGGFRLGLDLQPVTDQFSAISALKQLLALPGMPSAQHVIGFDLEPVALNLASMPLDEVLQFREQHGQQYRSYARNLHRFVKETSLLSNEERSCVFLERREELAHSADELRRLARRWWRRPLGTFGLGIIGATYQVNQAASTTMPLTPVADLVGTSNGDEITNSYGYIFNMQNSLVGT